MAIELKLIGWGLLAGLLLAGACLGTGLVELAVLVCGLVILAIPVTAYLSFTGEVVNSFNCESMKDEAVTKEHTRAALHAKYLLHEPISDADCTAAAAALAGTFTGYLTDAASREGLALPADQSSALAALSGATTCSDLDATYALPCEMASDSQPPLSFTIMMWVVGVGLFACLCCCYQGLRVKQNKGVGLM